MSLANAFANAKPVRDKPREVRAKRMHEAIQKLEREAAQLEAAGWPVLVAQAQKKIDRIRRQMAREGLA